MAYHEVPADVLEDRDELALWARKSIAVAAAVAERKQAKARKVRPKQSRGRASPAKQSRTKASRAKAARARK
jgi:hypothetical protein